MKLFFLTDIAVLMVGGGFGLAAWVMRDRLLCMLTPDGGASICRDLRYCPGGRGTLDVYKPKTAQNAPVVVFLHGGSWQTGRKSLYGALGNALAARGIVAVIPEYRLYPMARFPDFLEDAALATCWAKEHAADFGGNPGRLFLMGHSAGAHMAAMLSLDRQWLAKAGLDPSSDIAGLVGLAGPYDYGPLSDEIMIEIFGGADRPETHPINFVTPEAPPAFLATGADDIRVEPGNQARFAARLREQSVPVEEAVYAGRGHLGIILSFVGPLGFLTPVVRDVTRFIHDTPARRAGLEATAERAEIPAQSTSE